MNRTFPISGTRRFLHSGALCKPAFVFDIDGVLMHGKTPLPAGRKALAYLNGQNSHNEKWPFVLLTNGGGVDDNVRRRSLSEQLQVDLNPNQVIQSHTIFRNMESKYKELPALIVGGRGQICSEFASSSYGFKNAFSPIDIWHWNPSIWPFTETGQLNYKVKERDFSQIKFASVLVFHDPYDWGRDIQIMIDVLSSHNGQLGKPLDLVNDGRTYNGEESPQPLLQFSNPDLIWKNEMVSPRLGQGGFQAALKADWQARFFNSQLQSETLGKPSKKTYNFAAQMLRQVYNEIYSDTSNDSKLGQIYMIGDNPESDIAGANQAGWNSILVKTGVYQPHRGVDNPQHKPTVIMNDVFEGVQWALENESNS